MGFVYENVTHPVSGNTKMRVILVGGRSGQRRFSLLGGLKFGARESFETWDMTQTRLCRSLEIHESLAHGKGGRNTQRSLRSGDQEKPAWLLLQY